MPQNEPSHADEHDEAKEEQAGDRLSKSYSQDVDLSPSSRSKRETSKLNLDSPAEERIDWRLLKAAVDASNSLIVIADARQEDTPLIYVNEEFRRFTGYRVDEIIGKNCRFLQRRADGEMDRDQEDLARLREAIQQGEHARVTLRNYKKDGTPFYNELFISPVFDNADEIAYFIGVQNDVTGRVEAVRQLEESEKTLSSLFDSAPVLMGIVERRTSEGEDGEAYVHVRDNETAAAFFGIKPEVMRGKTDQELGFNELCQGQWGRAYAESEETGEPVRFECAFAPAEKPDLGGDGAAANGDISGTSFKGDGDERAGRERRLSVTVNFIERTGEGAARFSYLAEDVTGRRQSERERRLLQAAVEQADESLVITEKRLDPPGPRFVYVNPAFTRLTGYEPEEVIGKTPRMLQGPETDRAETDRLKRDLKEKGHFRGEAINYRKDGTTFVNEWHIAPLYSDGDGEVTHWVATQRDITQRREAEEEVRRLNRDLEERVRERTAELEEKNEALREAKEAAEAAAISKSAFLANMSHEIRTPLTAILGFASLLTRRLPDKFRKYAERIEKAGGRLMETLNLVLELARLDAREARVDLEPLAVAEDAREIVELFRARAEAKGLELTFSATSEARDVRALLDRGALSSILNNLVGNALKFTDEGRVAVTVRLSGATPGHVEIRVADTGIGIEPAFVPHLFDEFAQESEGQGRSHEGSGLGLAITQRLAHLMGGDVQAESEKGRGSAFTLRFPFVAEDEEGEAATAEAEAPPTGSREGLPSVLVVEDNEDTQLLLESLLEDDYRLAVTATAAEALAAAKDPPGGRPFRLVLLDINLGGAESGTDVLRELRAMPAYAAAPIVALTAYALPGDKERFEEAGFTTYLAKPFQFDDLIATVEGLMGGARGYEGEKV